MARWIELITDPSSNALSTSRCGLLIMNVVGAILAAVMVFKGHSLHAAAVLTGIAATDAGVYFTSTRKHFKENCDTNEGEQ